MPGSDYRNFGLIPSVEMWVKDLFGSYIQNRRSGGVRSSQLKS